MIMVAYCLMHPNPIKGRLRCHCRLSIIMVIGLMFSQMGCCNRSNTGLTPGQGAIHSGLGASGIEATDVTQEQRKVYSRLDVSRSEANIFRRFYNYRGTKSESDFDFIARGLSSMGGNPTMHISSNDILHILGKPDRVFTDGSTLLWSYKENPNVPSRVLTLYFVDDKFVGPGIGAWRPD